MLSTLLGMMTVVRLLQPRKAKLPMVVTFSGIVIDVALLHCLKALLPMRVTPSPTTMLVMLERLPLQGCALI